MKKIQSYTNDFIVHHVELWFKKSPVLTKDQYEMLKEMIWHMRDKK